MKKLLFASALAAASWSVLAADVYDIKFTAKTKVDDKLGSKVIQGLYIESDTPVCYFWTVDGKNKTPIADCRFNASVASADYNKGKGSIDSSELVWGEANGFVIGSAGTTSSSGNFAGMIDGVPAYGTVTIKKNSTLSKYNDRIEKQLPPGVVAAAGFDGIRNIIAGKEAELGAANEALVGKEAELGAANEALAGKEAELGAANEALAATNEVLAAANEMLAVSAAEIQAFTDALSQLNDGEVVSLQISRYLETLKRENAVVFAAATNKIAVWSKTPTVDSLATALAEARAAYIDATNALALAEANQEECWKAADRLAGIKYGWLVDEMNERLGTTNDLSTANTLYGELAKLKEERQDILDDLPNAIRNKEEEYVAATNTLADLEASVETVEDGLDFVQNLTLENWCDIFGGSPDEIETIVAFKSGKKQLIMDAAEALEAAEKDVEEQQKLIGTIVNQLNDLKGDNPTKAKDAEIAAKEKEIAEYKQEIEDIKATAVSDKIIEAAVKAAEAADKAVEDAERAAEDAEEAVDAAEYALDNLAFDAYPLEAEYDFAWSDELTAKENYDAYEKAVQTAINAMEKIRDDAAANLEAIASLAAKLPVVE